MDEITILQQAGLSEEQALTYQALLDKGPQKAGNLAQWTGIKRGLTYKVLQELESIGLVEKKEPAKGVATFFPLHPSSLLEGLERKKTELDRSKEALTHSLGSLTSKYNLMNGKPNVVFYEGLPGLQKLYNDINQEGENFLLIQSPKDRERPEIIPLLERQIKIQIEKSMHVRAITPLVEDTKEFIEKYDEKNLVTRRVVPAGLLNEPAQIIVYGERKIGITSFEKPMITTIIDDPAINQTFRTLFEIIWTKTVDEHQKVLRDLGIVNIPIID